MIIQGMSGVGLYITVAVSYLAACGCNSKLEYSSVRNRAFQTMIVVLMLTVVGIAILTFMLDGVFNLGVSVLLICVYSLSEFANALLLLVVCMAPEADAGASVVG